MPPLIERRVELGTAAPFDAAALHDYLRVHAVPGRDLVEDGELGASTHAIDVEGGLALARIEWAELRETAGEVTLPVRLLLPAQGARADHDEAAVVATLRRMLDLDADPALIAYSLGQDARLAPLLAARPGLRLPGARSPIEAALGTVLGQQVSLAAGRTLQSRLARAFQRTPLRSSDLHTDDVRSNGEHTGAPQWLGAPDVSAIAATDAENLRDRLGLTNSRARTLRGLAEALANGLDLSPAADHAATRSALLALHGIGPWTVEIIALRVLGDRDAYPAGDLILKRALDVTRERDAIQLAESWRPLRGYATQHLWAEFLKTQSRR